MKPSPARRISRRLPRRSVDSAVPLRRAVLEELEIPLVEPFGTSFGTERARRVLLLALESKDGEVGWAECVAGRDPLYSSESVATAREVLLRYLLPALRAREEVSVADFLGDARAIRGHPMAKATVEMALWELGARRAGRPLNRWLAPSGELRPRVEVGVSVGLQPSPSALVQKVREYRADGYRRIKLKVRPGEDRAFVRTVREAVPEAPLWIDANQAYDATSLPALARWARQERVELVEQPFGEDALLLHARLRQALGRKVLLCLDESITSVALFETARALGAVDCVNVKPGRLGGHAASVELHDRARRVGVPVWCGGMLETGIGRAHNLHLASLPNFRLPADLSASGRYWREDLVDPPFGLARGSTLSVPHGPGTGVEPEERVVARFRRRSRQIPLRRGI